jgi:hypothetical protein
MTSNINNNTSIPLFSTPSIRTQSLERHVHKWIDFSLNLIELWQNTRQDTRKIKLKKVRLSNQCQKILSEKLPRIVDMLFEVKNDINHHSTPPNENKIIMSFCEEFTTIRLILCTYPLENSSYSSGYSSVSHMASIEQQETKDFDLINKENYDISQKQLKYDCPSINDENRKATNINIPCINNVTINDIERKEDINAFICIQPSMQIQKNNYNSQPLFKLTFDSL